MSDRIRAGDVLTEAFRFGFYRWLTVFRMAWLPILLAMATVLGAIFLIFDVAALQALEDTPAPDMAGIADIMRMPPALAVLIGVGAGVVAMLLYCGVFASVYRLVALGEERPGFVVLRLDGPAMRVFFALLIMNLINYAVILVIGSVLLFLNGHSLGSFFAAFPDLFAMIEAMSVDQGHTPSPETVQKLAPIGVFMTGVLFSLPVIIYLNVKLSPFAPGSAAENRLLLFGSFRMTFGHAWSIFGVYVLFFIAMVVMSILYTLTMSFFEVMASLGGAVALVGVIFALVQMAAVLFYQVFVMGVQMALQAIIYRRLKTGE